MVDVQQEIDEYQEQSSAGEDEQVEVPAECEVVGEVGVGERGYVYGQIVVASCSWLQVA